MAEFEAVACEACVAAAAALEDGLFVKTCLAALDVIFTAAAASGAFAATEEIFPAASATLIVEPILLSEITALTTFYALS